MGGLCRSDPCVYGGGGGGLLLGVGIVYVVLLNTSCLDTVWSWYCVYGWMDG